METPVETDKETNISISNFINNKKELVSTTLTSSTASEITDSEVAGPSCQKESRIKTVGENTMVKMMELNNTKAGMEGLDLDKINFIIQNSTKGSKFYEHKKKLQEKLDERINHMKNQLAALSEEAISRSEKQVDIIAKKLEDRRDLSRVIVHIDMDAFYASVEERDDPSLKDKPMAVGCWSMLSTSNYYARRFGVRAAMPGFIAKKLCPQLIIVPPSFSKYSQASKEVEKVLMEYDNKTMSMFNDEAYLDISDYLAERNSLLSEGSQITPEEVVREMREKIFQKTQLTASAGIAVNALLAKICGDIRKPNNQYYLEPTVDAVKEFIKTLPIRKVGGIGNVTEQMLKGLEVQTCGDLWEKRAIINLLFSPATSSFLLAVSLGIGNSFLSKDSGSDDRKSVSCERTFSGTSDRIALKEMCRELSEELENDLQRKGVSGKTITLKIKTVNFEVKTRARSIATYTASAAIIFETAWSIYCSYEQEIDDLKLRLMGVRISNLRFKNEKGGDDDETDEFPSKQKTIQQMFAKTQEKHESPQQYTCPVCEEIFHSLKDIDSHIDSCLTSGIPEDTRISEVKIKSSEGADLPISELSEDLIPPPANYSVTCPICNRTFEFQSEVEAEERMNYHIDECLNKTTVQELVEETKKSMPVKRPHDNTRSAFRPSKKNKLSCIPIDSYFKPKS